MAREKRNEADFEAFWKVDLTVSGQTATFEVPVHDLSNAADGLIATARKLLELMPKQPEPYMDVPVDPSSNGQAEESAALEVMKGLRGEG